VAVAVCGVGELERDRHSAARLEVPRPSSEKRPRTVSTHHDREEVEQREPLVVPRQRPPRLFEEVRLGDPVFAQPVDQPVVRLDHRDLHLRDQQVHVLPRVADQRHPFLVARQVARRGAQQQLGRVVPLVEVWVADRPLAVQGLQVQPRAADVAHHRLVVVVRHWRAVGRDVVSDVLAEDRPPGRDGPSLRAPCVHRVAGATRAADRVQERRICREVGKCWKHAGIAVPVRAHRGAARRGQAVVPRRVRPCRRDVDVCGHD